jgi:DHA2 family multidrug resistance protein
MRYPMCSPVIEMLLSYMDQFRMICGIILCMLPLVFFLKRPAALKHVELDVH